MTGALTLAVLKVRRPGLFSSLIGLMTGEAPGPRRYCVFTDVNEHSTVPPLFCQGGPGSPARGFAAKRLGARELNMCGVNPLRGVGCATCPGKELSRMAVDRADVRGLIIPCDANATWTRYGTATLSAGITA